MNFITKYFTPERLVPHRKLAIPLLRNTKNKSEQGWPDIYNGRLYVQKPSENITCWNEPSLEIVQNNFEKAFVAGMNCFAEQTFISFYGPGPKRNSCILKVDTLEIVSEIDDNFVPTEESIAGENYILTYYRREESRGAPISLVKATEDYSSIIWEFLPEQSIRGFAVKDKSVVCLGSQQITALNIDSGDIIWQHSIADYNFPPQYEIQNSGIFIFNDIAIVAIKSYEYIGLNIETGDLLWKTERGFGGFACINSDGWLYRINHDIDDSSYCLWQVDCRTGEIKKRLMLDLDQLPDEAKNTMGDSMNVDVTCSHFWAGTGKGLLFAVNLETGNIDWQQSIGGQLTNLIICNNRLYVSTQDLSQLYDNKFKTEMFIFDGEGGYIPDE